MFEQVIHGQRVKLRPLCRSDARQIIIWQRDDAFEKYLKGDLPGQLQGKTGLRCRGFLIQSTSGFALGYISLEEICWKRGTAELRVFVKDRGRGYGTDAIRAMLRHTFSKTRLREIYLKVSTENSRAIKCYLRCGFKLAAVLRAGARSGRGFQDLYLMAVTRLMAKGTGRQR